MVLFFLFFRGSNIIENMVTMMEKHANHLEQLVEERTRQLNEEKEKTEKILCRLLPPYVLNLLNPSSGADPGFFLGGGALVSCSTSAPITHRFEDEDDYM